jgi:O-antigen/teichoic acid export membrane protein
VSKSGQHSARHIHRSLAWVGAASTVVSLLDIFAVFLVQAVGWVSFEQYGIQSYAYTLFATLDVAADLGLASSVISRDDHSEEKLSTVFWLNLMISCALFGALCLIGPALGRLQGHAIIGTLLIAYGGKLVFQNVYALPMSLMRKELRFAELSLIRVIANVVEAIVKIGLAAAGYPLWCFTIAALSRVFVTGVACQIRHPYRPKLYFRPREAAEYAKFGLRQSASQILYYFYTNFDYQVVGHFFGSAALGIYRNAYDIVLEPVRVISEVAIQVAFPAFARLRSDAKRVVEQFIGFARMNLVTVLPFVCVIFLVADDILYLIFGPSANGGAHAARILCLVGLLRAMSFMGPPLLDGLGKPHLTLRYQTLASIALPACFIAFAAVLGPHLDFYSVAWAWATGYPIAFALLAYIVLDQIDLSVKEYFRRTFGIMACAAAGMVAGALVSLAADSLPRGAHLAIVSTVVLGVTFVLLAYTQDIHPKSIGKALKG